MNVAFPPIEQLVPHRGPALLIDAVLAETPDSIRVAAHTTSAHPYYVPGRGVPAWVGIELMAQALAAQGGVEAGRHRRAAGGGMLLGTHHYHAQAAYFPENARLEIRAQREFGDDTGIVACACTITCGGETLAEATIIALQTAPEPAP